MPLDSPLDGTPTERLKDVATLVESSLLTLDAFLDPDDETVGAIDLDEMRTTLAMALELAKGRA